MPSSSQTGSGRSTSSATWDTEIRPSCFRETRGWTSTKRTSFYDNGDTADRGGDHMYAVAGATGHTGGMVASTLLESGKPVRVIVRNEEKGRIWRERGAEVALASIDDPASLEQAIAGADGLYFLVPPDMSAPDVL